MDFFSKLGQKASETYKGATEKAGKLAGEAKLKMKINDCKSKIEDVYKEIGRKIYEAHATNSVINEAIVEEPCTRIDVLNAEIDAANKEIISLKDRKTCVNCGAEIQKNVKFCPSCGKEQPEPAQPVQPAQPTPVESVQPTGTESVSEPDIEQSPVNNEVPASNESSTNNTMPVNNDSENNQ